MFSRKFSTWPRNAASNGIVGTCTIAWDYARWVWSRLLTLIPKRLLDYAGIEAEVVMAGQSGKIEMWDSGKYGGVSEVDEDFAAMAEKILGGTFDEADT